MQVQLIRRKEKPIVRLKGELDHHTAEEFRDFVDRGLENNPVKHLILDLTHLSFMDSSGIGVLIGRFKKVNFRGGKVAVVNENKQVSRVLEVSGIYDIIKSYSSISKAVNDL